MTAKHRRQFRNADLTPDKAATSINDALLDIYRRLEAEEDEVVALGTEVEALTPTALALGAFGSSANSNGASLSYTEPTYTLTLQPASATNPGGVTTGTQTFAGEKTFSGEVFLGQGNNANVGDYELRFHNSTTYHLIYQSSPSNRLEYSAPLHHFVGGNIQNDVLTTSDRYGIITKDDQSGTPGNFSTTRSAGRAAIAAGATQVVITNNTAGKAFAATDDAYVTLISADATLTRVIVVMTANTLTITGNAAATADCSLSWFVVK